MRNSRLPDSLARRPRQRGLGLPPRRARGSPRSSHRYGVAQVEACFEAILARTTETFRRELLARIPDGTYVWEDYAEHDGVDPPRLHAQRITMTKSGGRLILDFAGTEPSGQRPDQPRRQLRGRRVPQEVARADPAQPRRHAGAHGRARRQRGRGPADRAALPAAGHAPDAGLPGADQRPHVRDPAPARRPGRSPRQGHRGRMPADQETIRVHRLPRRRTRRAIST